MKPTLLTFALLVAGALAAKAESSPGLEVNQGQGELEIRFKGQKLLVYAFATNQFKPYVRELYTLRGENVLRDAPADHLHHHGLMYAIHVGGTNFWEEVGAAGVEKSVNLLNHRTTTKDGLLQAQFTHLIHWVDFKNRSISDSAAAALLIEQRTLTLTVDEKNQEIALRWDSGFEVGNKNAGKATLHGASYNGLGLRLPKSFDHVANFQNSANGPYTSADSHDVIGAKWSSVSGSIDGRTVMVILFSHIGNARGDGWFFSMRDPFAYLSATQGLDKAPVEYVAGTKFHLNYLLAIYPESKTREFAEGRYERWEKEGR